MSPSPLFSTSTIVLVIVIAVLVELTILYCLVRYCCKKTTPTRASPQLEVNHQHVYQNQEVQVEPEVLSLNSLSRDGRNLPADKGQCSTNEQNTYSMNKEHIYHIYAEIEELGVFPTAQTTPEEPEVLPLKSLSKDGRNHPANNGRCSRTEQNTYSMNEAYIYDEIEELGVFSTAQTITAQHLSKNKEPCAGANEGVKANTTNAQVPIQQDFSSIDTYGTFSSSTSKNSPTSTTPLSNIPLPTSKLTTKSESGKLQSHKPEPSPRKAKKKIDCSEPSYVNVPKKT